MAEALTNPAVSALAETIAGAFHDRQPMVVRGGGSKSFLGHIEADAAVLDTRSVRGIVSYEPRELVLRVRAGTPLAEVKQVLADEGQMLPFEPPDFGGAATIGGMVSAGIAGPRRPWVGAVRDFVLGVGLITGDGRVLEFGGQVMKNVAGYDVSRLVTGAMGTLGVITDVSMKVLPRPSMELTVCQERTVKAALDKTLALGATAMPLSATCYIDGQLYLRFSGSESAVRQAVTKAGGEAVDNEIWEQVAHHQLKPLSDDHDVWRVSTSPASGVLLEEASVIEWGGGQRWLVAPDFNPRDILAEGGGHATLFRTGRSREPAFHPLAPGIRAIHQGLKHCFDPGGVLNPGRMYEGL